MNVETRLRFQSMLQGLNSTQKESVLSEDQTLQILAGPGSGKTKVLTCRVAYFVNVNGIKPQNIVVVTFTNKAAAEMKARLSYLIGKKETDQLMIGTFHAICCRLLRQHAKTVDLEGNFTVADTDISKQIIGRLRKDHNIAINHFTRSKMEIGAIWGLISRAKSKGETCDIYCSKYGTGYKTKDIATLYRAYEAELKKLNLVDFDNLLIKACELLRKKRLILAHIKCILVDEYQDTNIVQYDLIKLMTLQDNKKSLTIVGDPDQSIYGFRSAEPQNFTKMQNEYSNTSIIHMDQNYRSTATILKAALHVISHDKSRIEKTLHTNNPTGKSILRIQTSDESVQAQFVAKEIKKVINGSNGLVGYRDFAILMRVNATSQQFEQTFRANKIPFTIVGGDRFFNRVEVKDILSYLRFIFNPKDQTSFTRIVNVPKRGVGDTNLQKILNKNETDRTDLLETIMAIGKSESSFFNDFIKKSMLQLGQICLNGKRMMDDKESISKIIRYIIEEIKYFDYLKQNYFQDHITRWDNIAELMSIAQQSPSADNDLADDTLNGNDSADDTLNGNDSAGGSASTIDLSDHSSDEKGNVNSSTPPDVRVVNHSSFTAEKANDNVNEDVPELSMSEFLEYCSLCSDQKELEEAEGGKVVIATLHSSKGLEWPCVFIATCNDGVIPHQMSDSIDEECRLLYVAMTRSKFLLYCISPNERITWGGSTRQSPSRFLNNMDESIYDTSPHVWDEEMRLMLAETIGRTYSDDVAATRNGQPKRKSSETEEIAAKKPRCE